MIAYIKAAISTLGVLGGVFILAYASYVTQGAVLVALAILLVVATLFAFFLDVFLD